MVFSLNILSAAALAAAAAGLFADQIGLGADDEFGFHQLRIVSFSLLAAFVLYGSRLHFGGSNLCPLRFHGSAERLAAAGLLAASVLILQIVRMPYVWTALLWTAFLLWCARRAKRFGWLVLYAAAVPAALGTAEAYIWLSEPYRSVQYEILEAVNAVRAAKEHRRRRVPNLRVRMDSRIAGEARVRSTIQTTDRHGLRAVPQTAGAEKSLLFFGGSYTFGSGVDDEESMPYQTALMLDEYQVYNFGFPAHGPHQVLRMLERGDIYPIVREPPRHAVFQLIFDHVRRVAGHVPYFPRAPRYELADGTPVYRGQFRDEKMDYLLKVNLRKSKLYRTRIEPNLVDNTDIALTAAVLARIDALIRKRYENCSFNIVFWDFPQSAEREELLRQIEKRGLRVHRLSRVLREPEGSIHDRELLRDGHPGITTHERIAVYVVEHIVG